MKIDRQKVPCKDNIKYTQRNKTIKAANIVKQIIEEIFFVEQNINKRNSQIKALGLISQKSLI